jgi:hypothetical protein
MGLNRTLDIAQGSRRIELDMYTYSTVFNTLGAAATVTQQIAITADSDFVLDALCLVSYSAAGVLIPNPDYTVALVDTGSGRALQDQNIHVNNITGTGQLPYWLPEPKLFKGSASIGVTLTNNTPVAAVVSIAFIGRKVFYLQGFNRDLLYKGMGQIL